MPVIGVTGRMGSGKSTVSRILSQNGVIVIDADQISREVVKKGTKALEEIVNEFGEEVIKHDGELDRQKLAAIVFYDAKKLDKLNEIVHKDVGNMIEIILKDRKKEDFYVLDVPLPVREGFLDQCDEIWVVTAPTDDRISRIKKRSNLDEDEILRRLSMQPSEDEYLSIADRVIENKEDLFLLEKEVMRLLEKFKLNGGK